MSVNKRTEIAKEDARLLDRLTQFPDLYATYMEVLSMPIEVVIRELSETLTAGIIGYVAGVTDRTVRRWVRGRHRPEGTRRQSVAVRLRAMLTAVRILQEAERPKVVLRWFANINPDLDGNAPAEALQQGEKLDWVIRSAAAYARDGV